MTSDEQLRILRVRPSQIAERALVVGEPKRAAAAAELLENAEEVGSYREYVTYTGHYKGKRVTVASHGVGGAGASVAFHELFEAGVTTVIRAGTCGAAISGLIVATGAVRADGTSDKLVPLAYPAVADYRVVHALHEAASANGYPDPLTGIVLTKSFLYPGIIESDMDMWFEKAGVVAVEMELATLLVMAGIRGVRAGGIFASDEGLGAQKEKESGYDPFHKGLQESTQAMLPIAFDALVALE